MEEPPRSPDGKVIPHDHAEILNDHVVIRRISKEHLFSAQDGSGTRISSMAYQASSEPGGGMSIDLLNLIVTLGHDSATFLLGGAYVGAVRFVVEPLRAMQFKVGYDPLVDNECHGEVWGKFNDRKKRALKRAARWEIEIPDVSLT